MVNKECGNQCGITCGAEDATQIGDEEKRLEIGEQLTISACRENVQFDTLTLSRPVLQICNTKFNYLQLIRFLFKITSKQL